jgi:peptidoglycan L-alanyl-D-glutamate endopeptidase CwlK
MSSRLFSDDILFYQRILSVAGLYKGKLDGKWSASLDAADQAFSAQFDKIASSLGAFDVRTEGNLRTVLPETQRAARSFLTRAKRDFDGFDVRILSGSRTYAEQDLLYRKGRFGNPPPKVTNARGGQSNHNFGIAWDVGIFKNGKYLTGDTKSEAAIYKKLASIAKTADLEWGGDWTSIVDMPHYQLKLDLTLTQVRKRFEQGKAYS